MIKILNTVFLVLLFVGCATPNTRLQGKPCQTTCGMRLYGSNECQSFQEAENRAVKIFSEHYPNSCDRLYGWVVYVQPVESHVGGWQSPAGDMVAGLTWCRHQTMQVQTDYWSFSSLAHEIMHAVECGERLMDKDPHKGWDGNWQSDAIRRAQ